MSTVVIRYDGTDITAKVIIAEATFSSAAKGVPGTCSFRVKDLMHTETFIPGKSLTLDINGIRQWGGFVTAVKRGYFFSVDNADCPALTPRDLLIEGTDYNILLHKRVLYNKADPANLELTAYPPGTSDQTIIRTYITGHTDMATDGINLATVEAVDTPTLDGEFQAGSSWSVSEFLSSVGFHIGSIWYLDPEKRLIYTDVDTPSAPYGISDQPGPGEVGCRELEINYDGNNLRNDVMVWGAGGGDDVPVFRRIEDADSIAAHGRWQLGNLSYGAWKQETVDKIANSYVYGSPQSQRGGKDDAPSARCEVRADGFRVAQKVTIRSVVHGITETIPIRQIDINFESPTAPLYRLTLAHEIDTPLSLFDPIFFQPIELPELPPVPPLPTLDCLLLPRKWTLPIEILFKYHIVDLDNGIVASLTLGLVDAHGPAATNDRFEVIINGTLNNLAVVGEGNGTVFSQSGVSKPGLGNAHRWGRLRAEPQAVKFRTWLTNESEPDTWDATATTTATSLRPINFLYLQAIIATNRISGSMVELDSIRFMQGLSQGQLEELFQRDVQGSWGISPLTGGPWLSEYPETWNQSVSNSYARLAATTGDPVNANDGYLYLPIASASAYTGDDFNRVVSSGWGQPSGLPSKWVQSQLSPELFFGVRQDRLSVNGTSAISLYDADVPTVDSKVMTPVSAGSWVGISEVLFKFRFHQTEGALTTHGSYLLFGLANATAIPAEPESFTAWVQFKAGFDSGVIKLELFDCEVLTLTTENASIDPGVIINEDIEDDWVWGRWRIEEADVMVRVWKDGTSEPSTWTRKASTDGDITLGFLGNSEGTDHTERIFFFPQPDEFGVSIEIDTFQITQGFDPLFLGDNFNRVHEISGGESWTGTWGKPSHMPNLWQSCVLETATEVFFRVNGGSAVAQSGDGVPYHFGNPTQATATGGVWAGEVEYLIRFDLVVSTAPTNATDPTRLIIWFLDRGANINASTSAAVIANAYMWYVQLEFDHTPPVGSDRFLVSSQVLDKTSHQAAFADIDTGLGNSQHNKWIWMRARLQADDVKVKFWLDGSSEPTSWTMTAAINGAVDAGSDFATNFVPDLANLAMTVRMEHDISQDVRWEIDFFEITSGWDGGSPCYVSGSSPMAQAQYGRRCENLARMDRPDGYPSAQYLAASSAFFVKTTEVWVDGLFLKPTLYTEYPSKGWIGVDNSVNLGGDEARNPTKVVWMCATMISTAST